MIKMPNIHSLFLFEHNFDEFLFTPIGEEERGEMSRRAATRRYEISESVAIKWLERLNGMARGAACAECARKSRAGA